MSMLFELMHISQARSERESGIQKRRLIEMAMETLELVTIHGIDMPSDQSVALMSTWDRLTTPKPELNSAFPSESSYLLICPAQCTS